MKIVEIRKLKTEELAKLSSSLGDEIVGHPRAVQTWKDLIPRRAFSSCVVEYNSSRVVEYNSSG